MEFVDAPQDLTLRATHQGTQLGNLLSEGRQQDGLLVEPGAQHGVAAAWWAGGRRRVDGSGHHRLPVCGPGRPAKAKTTRSSVAATWEWAVLRCWAKPRYWSSHHREGAGMTRWVAPRRCTAAAAATASSLSAGWCPAHSPS